MYVADMKIFDKEILKSNFSPFQKPDEISGMIIGNDLDSLISACFQNTQFGWNIVGCYGSQPICRRILSLEN